MQERLEERVESERILCVSHWGFIHFFLGAAIFREDFAPAHLPALYRMSHINTGITIFEQRRDYLIEGDRLRRLGAADLERPGAPLAQNSTTRLTTP